MPTRTLKLIGKAWGNPAVPVRVDVLWNNQEVYSGTVETTSGIPGVTHWNDLRSLCAWTQDGAVTGNIPLAVKVTNGTLLWATVHANYVGWKGGAEIVPGSTWPRGTPSDANLVLAHTNAPGTGNPDVGMPDGLTDQQFLDTYGIDKATAQSQLRPTLLQGPADYFADVSLPRYNQQLNPTDDGHYNVMVNGVPVNRTFGGSPWPGDWHYEVPAGATLTCQVKVLPPVTEITPLAD